MATTAAAKRPLFRVRYHATMDLLEVILFGKLFLKDVWLPAYKARSWAKRFLLGLRFLKVWPHYYQTTGTDCDGYRLSHYWKAPTFWHANRYMDQQLDWADGPMQFHRVTRKEYREATTSLGV
jgi:hypothetical protein